MARRMWRAALPGPPQPSPDGNFADRRGDGRLSVAKTAESGAGTCVSPPNVIPANAGTQSVRIEFVQGLMR